MVAETNVIVTTRRYGELVGRGSIGRRCSVCSARLSTEHWQFFVAAFDLGKVQPASTLTGCHGSTLDLVLLVVALVSCEAQIR